MQASGPVFLNGDEWWKYLCKEDERGQRCCWMVGYCFLGDERRVLARRGQVVQTTDIVTVEMVVAVMRE